MYTVQRWLIPSDQDAACLTTYQPTLPDPTQFWTDDFTTCAV